MINRFAFIAIATVFAASLVALFASAAEFKNDHDIIKFNQWLETLDPNLKIHVRRSAAPKKSKDSLSIAGGAASDKESDDDAYAMGSGVFTNSSIKKGQRVLSVPISYVLCDETLTQHPSKYDGVEYFTVLSKHIKSQDDQIAAALMTERALRSSSKWAPWIRVLPELGVGLNLPFTWPKDIRDSILPLNVRSQVKRMAQDTKARYDSLNVVFTVLREHVRQTLRSNNIKVSKKQLEKDFSVERYMWANSLVFSRAWNLNGRKYLVPGADMFNHAYDMEDKQFDFKRDSTIRMQRSQKFTYFHLINKTVPGEMRADVVSDRTEPLRNQELFESYGDSSDTIYFTYLGFVASDVESLLVAAFLPPNDDDAPHLDIDLFAKAWGMSTVRNRRDCLDIALQEPAQVVKQENSTASASPAFNSPQAPMIFWAKRMLGIGGNDGRGTATVCVRFDEIHPLLMAFHYLIQLPPEIVQKNDCIAHNVDTLARHLPTTKLYPAVTILMRQVKTCLKKTYGPVGEVNNTLRAIASLTNDLAKSVVPVVFEVRSAAHIEQIEVNIVDEAIEAVIINCRLRGVNERDKCFKDYPFILESDFAPNSSFAGSGNLVGAGELGVTSDVANLMRIRLALQHQMTLLRLQDRLESKRVKAQEKLSQLLGEDVDGTDGAASATDDGDDVKVSGGDL